MITSRGGKRRLPRHRRARGVEGDGGDIAGKRDFLGEGRDRQKGKNQDQDTHGNLRFDLRQVSSCTAGQASPKGFSARIHALLTMTRFS